MVRRLPPIYELDIALILSMNIENVNYCKFKLANPEKPPSYSCNKRL
jgi:hypothetical protein